MLSSGRWGWTGRCDVFGDGKTVKRVERGERKRRRGGGRQLRERLSFRGRRCDVALSWEPLSYETQASMAPRALCHHWSRRGSVVSFISASFFSSGHTPVLQPNQLRSWFAAGPPVNTSLSPNTQVTGEGGWNSSHEMAGGLVKRYMRTHRQILVCLSSWQLSSTYYPDPDPNRNPILTWKVVSNSQNGPT